MLMKVSNLCIEYMPFVYYYIVAERMQYDSCMFVIIFGWFACAYAHNNPAMETISGILLHSGENVHVVGVDLLWLVIVTVEFLVISLFSVFACLCHS